MTNKIVSGARGALLESVTVNDVELGVFGSIAPRSMHAAALTMVSQGVPAAIVAPSVGGCTICASTTFVMVVVLLFVMTTLNWTLSPLEGPSPLLSCN